MTTSNRFTREGSGGTTAVASALLLVGLGLAGWATYSHLELANQVQAGHCNGCEPWHPLLIVAPLAVGAVFTLTGGYLLYR